MKYLIVGAGGVGASVGGFLSDGGLDVTLIARGAHLKAMQENGLLIKNSKTKDLFIRPVKAVDMPHYDERPDVVFVCVKGYSVDETVPFLKRIGHPGMVVIPLLNVYGTGSRLQEKLPSFIVADGCIYIVAEMEKPGIIRMNSPVFRIVFGLREEGRKEPVFEKIKQDLTSCGIKAVISANIRRDAMRKFIYISAAAACGQYYDVKSESFQVPGEVRDTFRELLRELSAIAAAMGLVFEKDPVAENMNIMDHQLAGSDTSLQRDLRLGKPSEVDGLIFQVVRWGEEFGVEVPAYEKIAVALGYKGGKQRWE